MPDTIELIRQELLANADEATKVSGKRFFKEEIELYGVKTATVTKIAKQAFKKIKSLPKDKIFALCEQLWQSGLMEESFIACNWAYQMKEQFTKDDFFVFEKWVNRYVSNWASCDTLCNQTVGTLVEMYPACLENLKRWTGSKNRWVRRAAAVTLIIPARMGLFKEDVLEIADKLLLDSDDLVQKGYGWMLKSLSQSYEEEVYRYVLGKREIMPRTALRYAIEKMPREKKEEAMKKAKRQE